MSTRERAAKRLAMRKWRERHPIMSAWHIHLASAKRRGIAVLWSFDEFFNFCTETGYHLLKADGFQMHRDGDVGPYAYGRVSLVPGEINRQLQDYYVERWRKHRLHIVATNGRV